MKKKLYLIFIALSCRLLASASVADSLYVETPVILETQTGKIFGTLTVPVTFNKGPVVLIIAGSGPTDRDGNNPMMKNNSLLQAAHSLAKTGIASLRYDKRGIAASAEAMKNEEDIRFDDYVNDAIAWIGFLRKDKRFSTITLAGHSEGSLIGMIAANGKADKFISIAGAGQPAAAILKEQLASQPTEIKDACYQILDSLSAGLTVSNVSPMFFSLFRPSVQPYMISWFRYDPQAEIAKLKIPTLILQGSNDLQVSETDANYLYKAKKDASLVIIPGMNHVLKIVSDSQEENIKSYSDPTLPISGSLINSMVSFINQ
jgi:pimeloyl-ACP methyl ester carboxylesterase